MDSRWIGIIAFLLVVITAVAFLRPRNEGQATPEVGELRVLELGDGRAVRIMGRLLRDQRQAYYYQVELDGEVIAEPAFFGSLPPGSPMLAFEWHAATDGDLLGFVTDFQPDAVLFMFDFATGASWPDHAGNETVEMLQARGQRMFAPLAEAHPDKSLTLFPAEGLRPLPISPDSPYAKTEASN